MNKTVIIINGYGTCGKDKFVKLFGRVIPLNEEMENISTVDDVKELSKQMGWDGYSKTEADRQLWVDLKAARTRYNNGIFEGIIKRIFFSNSSYFFVHCREPKEIQKFVDHYGKTVFTECATLLVVRDGVEPPNNESDRSVMNYDYDYTVLNNGTLGDLLSKAEDLRTDLQDLHDA